AAAREAALPRALARSRARDGARAGRPRRGTRLAVRGRMSEELTPGARARLLRAAATPSADGELLYGRYRITRELGRGGMGIVYEAEDVALRRRVALKILRLPAQVGPGLAEQVLREARAAARLDHPNIAAVYDAHDDAIALQFIE